MQQAREAQAVEIVPGEPAAPPADLPGVVVASIADDSVSAPYTLASSPRLAPPPEPVSVRPPPMELCTVWVERVGGQRVDDEALLRGLEAVLSLRPHTLSRTGSMDRPRFRLVHAVPSLVAEQVAILALGEGLQPMVVTSTPSVGASRSGIQLAVAALAMMATCWTGMAAVVGSVAVVLVRGQDPSSSTRMLLVIAALVVVFASTALVPIAVELLRTRVVGDQDSASPSQTVVNALPLRSLWAPKRVANTS